MFVDGEIGGDILLVESTVGELECVKLSGVKNMFVGSDVNDELAVCSEDILFRSV